jgi:hypothetical protein
MVMRFHQVKFVESLFCLLVLQRKMVNSMAPWYLWRHL